MVIDGHSHETVPEKSVKNADGRDVLLTQTGTKLKDIGKLTIRTDGSITTELVTEVPAQDTAQDYIVQKNDSLSKIAARELGDQNRWIDIYENEGKRSGAYSWGAYGTHPYVLLNYQGTLDHVFTLAHEMGHALHSYYSDANQPYINAGYKIFVAEVASTCNESLLIHNLLNKTEDKDTRAFLINHFLEQFKGTLYRQTMFAEFEKITHDMVWEGETLTADKLCEIYYDLNKFYFGEDIVLDEEIALEWARIPHFYNPFYVYQYATGISAAIALSGKIMKEGEAGVKDYMKFLTGGGSKDPIDLLKLAGVDMTEKEPVSQALKLFEELLDEMESIVG